MKVKWRQARPQGDTVSHFFSFSRVNKKCNLYIHTGAKRSTLGAFDMRCTVRTVRSSSRLRSKSCSPRARIRIRVAGARVASLGIDRRDVRPRRARDGVFVGVAFVSFVRPRVATRASRWSSARGRLGTGRRVGTRAAQTAVASSALPPKSRAEAGARDVASWFGSLFGGGGGAAKREAAKAELLAAIDGCERGVTADADRRSAVDAAASRLERLNPTRAALRSPPRGRVGAPVHHLRLHPRRQQTLAVPPARTHSPDPRRGRLRASNRETFPFYNAVDADLTPTGASSVDVQFVKFFIFGLIPVVAPPSARGALAVTYLDEDIRVSRGDRGNLFVLRVADRERRLPRAGDEDQDA